VLSPMLVSTDAQNMIWNTIESVSEAFQTATNLAAEESPMKALEKSCSTQKWQTKLNEMQSRNDNRQNLLDNNNDASKSYEDAIEEFGSPKEVHASWQATVSIMIVVGVVVILMQIYNWANDTHFFDGLTYKNVSVQTQSNMMNWFFKACIFVAFNFSSALMTVGSNDLFCRSYTDNVAGIPNPFARINESAQSAIRIVILFFVPHFAFLCIRLFGVWDMAYYNNDRNTWNCRGTLQANAPIMVMAIFLVMILIHINGLTAGSFLQVLDKAYWLGQFPKGYGPHLQVGALSNPQVTTPVNTATGTTSTAVGAESDIKADLTATLGDVHDYHKFGMHANTAISENVCGKHYIRNHLYTCSNSDRGCKAAQNACMVYVKSALESIPGHDCCHVVEATPVRKQMPFKLWLIEQGCGKSPSSDACMDLMKDLWVECSNSYHKEQDIKNCMAKQKTTGTMDIVKNPKCKNKEGTWCTNKAQKMLWAKNSNLRQAPHHFSTNHCTIYVVTFITIFVVVVTYMVTVVNVNPSNTEVNKLVPQTNQCVALGLRKLTFTMTVWAFTLCPFGKMHQLMIERAKLDYPGQDTPVYFYWTGVLFWGAMFLALCCVGNDSDPLSIKKRREIAQLRRYAEACQNGDWTDRIKGWCTSTLLRVIMWNAIGMAPLAQIKAMLMTFSSVLVLIVSWTISANAIYVAYLCAAAATVVAVLCLVWYQMPSNAVNT